MQIISRITSTISRGLTLKYGFLVGMPSVEDKQDAIRQLAVGCLRAFRHLRIVETFRSPGPNWVWFNKAKDQFEEWVRDSQALGRGPNSLEFQLRERPQRREKVLDSLQKIQGAAANIYWLLLAGRGSEIQHKHWSALSVPLDFLKQWRPEFDDPLFKEEASNFEAYMKKAGAEPYDVKAGDGQNIKQVIVQNLCVIAKIDIGDLLDKRLVTKLQGDFSFRQFLLKYRHARYGERATSTLNNKFSISRLYFSISNLTDTKIF